MKIAIILDNKVNKWALQRFEPLRDEIDITVFVGENNDYDVNSIDLPKKKLKHTEEIAHALEDPVTTYKRVIRAPFKKMDFYYFSLRKHLRGFDAVYSCDIMRSAYTLACLKEEMGFKFVLSWWENIPYRALFDAKTRYLKRSVMDKVDLFLPFTEKAGKTLEMEGVRSDRIKVLYPGVNLERFKPGDKNMEIMSRYSISPNLFVIAYVGKLVSWKGVHNLAYAARILKLKGITDFIITISGKGAQKENLENLIKEAGVGEHFRFLDFVPYDDMPEVFRMADAFVLPSYPTMTWQEQFGMVLSEAMASGVPVISTRSGSIPEVIGDAGILISPGDYSALAEAILELKRNESLRKDLSVRSRCRAEELYSDKKIAGEFGHILRRI